MKTLIVLLALALVPCFAQQVAAASDDDVVLQHGTQGDVEDDGRRQLWTSIATNTAKTLGIGAALMVLLFISTAVLRWLWNTTVPNVFNLNAITFWQCFRLLIMVKILLVGGSGIIKAM